MFLGISLSPWTWFMLIVAAAFSLIIPFTIIGSIASYLPPPFDTIAEVVLAGIGFPVLLGYLHSRKIFGRGIGSVFFTIYTWFYLVLGLFAIGFGYLAYDSPQYDGMIVGAVLFATGCALIWWAKRTNLAFADAISADAEHQAALDREEQIQIQAEAIARAENMKNN